MPPMLDDVDAREVVVEPTGQGQEGGPVALALDEHEGSGMSDESRGLVDA